MAVEPVGTKNDWEVNLLGAISATDIISIIKKEIEDFAEKLEKQYPEICYVSRLITHSWGQKVIRFYDLDGNLIEVGTPV